MTVVPVTNVNLGLHVSNCFPYRLSRCSCRTCYVTNKQRDAISAATAKMEGITEGGYRFSSLSHGCADTSSHRAGGVTAVVELQPVIICLCDVFLKPTVQNTHIQRQLLKL